MDNSANSNHDSDWIDSAVRAVQEKKDLPEIDFSLHTMEDGSQVSTLDRVCKGLRLAFHARDSSLTFA